MTAPLFGDVEAKKRAKKPSTLDPRHQPLIEFCFETYREARGNDLIIDGRGVNAIKAMLKDTKDYVNEYTLDRLKLFWVCFLERSSDFDRKQPPLVWFCRNIQRWANECTVSPAKPQSSIDMMREWTRKKLAHERRTDPS